MARCIFLTTAPGKELGDTIAHVQYPTAGGSAAWNADGSGVYYTRFPRKGERPEEDLNFYQQVYFHKLGTPDSADTYSIGKEFPRIAEVKLESSTTASTSWLRSRMVTVETLPIICWARTAPGSRSRSSAIR